VPAVNRCYAGIAITKQNATNDSESEVNYKRRENNINFFVYASPGGYCSLTTHGRTNIQNYENNNLYMRPEEAWS
jgi:hypothetical protein